MRPSDYPMFVEPLPAEDGGGFVATAPDLPGCMSDGETPEEAIRNLRDAVEVWLATAMDAGRSIPTPSPRRAYA